MVGLSCDGLLVAEEVVVSVFRTLDVVDEMTVVLEAGVVPLLFCRLRRASLAASCMAISTSLDAKSGSSLCTAASAP